ncbi:uncharacterized protein LOC114851025 [Betta splendens]|uniref:Uncharacterized protein LOC114851025 n=1 Tax=Betta splendens TaxID=158456 RepID=A0A8M1HBS7_BETSP|nr:uncharacterized protein LOC114851025 [Betta splendens]
MNLVRHRSEISESSGARSSIMMRVLLGLFYLSGCLVFCSSIHRKYTLFTSSKTWAQAQTYCRQKNADLVTFETIGQVQFMTSFSSAGQFSDVWIGLICEYADFWSPSFNGSIMEWQNQSMMDPLFAYHFCGSFSKNGLGYQHPSVKNPFICSNGTQLVFVNETVDWFSAWTYCRESLADLTAPLGPSWNDSQNGAWYSDVLSIVPSGCQAWTGLYKYPFTLWSDGSSSSFRYWDNLQAPPVWIPRIYGVTNFNNSERWRLVPDGGKLPFICLTVSEDQVAETDLKVLQLRMSSSLDVSNPTVSAIILTQLQVRLLENGVSGVTLKWREHPDGKVFHKEKGADVTHDGC